MIPILKIREVRLLKGLTQKQLANLIPISQGYLSGLENNNKNPTLKQLCKIAEALNVNPSELVHYV